MAMVTHIQTSIPKHPQSHHSAYQNPASVRHARKAGDRCRSQLPIGDPSNFFFFHLSSRSVTLRLQRRFISNPAPNLGSLLRKAAGSRPCPLSCTIRRLRPILERYALLDVLTLCVLSAVEACADGASRAAIFFRSHSGLSIGMPY